MTGFSTFKLCVLLAVITVFLDLTSANVIRCEKTDEPVDDDGNIVIVGVQPRPPKGRQGGNDRIEYGTGMIGDQCFEAQTLPCPYGE